MPSTVPFTWSQTLSRVTILFTSSTELHLFFSSQYVKANDACGSFQGIILYQPVKFKGTFYPKYVKVGKWNYRVTLTKVTSEMWPSLSLESSIDDECSLHAIKDRCIHEGEMYLQDLYAIEKGLRDAALRCNNENVLSQQQRRVEYQEMSMDKLKHVAVGRIFSDNESRQTEIETDRRSFPIRSGSIIIPVMITHKGEPERGPARSPMPEYTASEPYQASAISKLKEHGDKLLVSGDIHGAVRAYDGIIAPTAAVNANLGLAKWMLDSYDDAIGASERALKSMVHGTSHDRTLECVLNWRMGLLRRALGDSRLSQLHLDLAEELCKASPSTSILERMIRSETDQIITRPDRALCTDPAQPENVLYAIF